MSPDDPMTPMTQPFQTNNADSTNNRWEHAHEALCESKLLTPEGCSEAEQLYMKGMEYQMSGNELWSKTTMRYRVVH